ncbi:MAG: PIG-L family deacetylase [Acidobacteriota bacterium]
MKNRSPQRKVRHPFARFLSLLCLLVLVTAPRAQEPSVSKQSPENRVALYQALLDLTNPWTVMCIAAHPDDEDGTSLIVMRRKYGAHTVSLFSTFGEGGQNAIGPELYEELGAIRVNETLAASKIQGSEPYFLGLNDYGFSKSADEAFKIWGHEEALRRMVLQIRKLRPDVIITNHSVTSNDHGQHQATARLTVEAFDAAADPNRFPEQLKEGLTVWQVQRLFVRAGRSSNPVPTETKPVVTIDPNERDPIRDTSFAEEALRALHEHATQGPWPKTVAQLASRFRNSTDGKLPMIRYVLSREAKGGQALPKDSHSFLDGLRLPASIAGQLVPPTIDGRPLTDRLDDNSLVFDQLAKYWKAVQASYASFVDQNQSYFNSNAGKPDDFYRYMPAIRKISRALALSAQLDFRVDPNSIVTSSSGADLSLRISNRSNQTVNFIKCFSCGEGQTCRADPPAIAWRLRGSLSQNPVAKNDRMLPGTDLVGAAKLPIPDQMAVNVPLSRHLYQPNALGFELNTSCSVEVKGALFLLSGSTRVNMAPAVEIASIKPSPLVITPQTSNKPIGLTLQIVNHEKTGIRGTIEGVFESTTPRGTNGTKIVETPLTLAPSEQRDVKVTMQAGRMEMRIGPTRTYVLPGKTAPKTEEPAAPAPPPLRGLVFRMADKSSNEARVSFVFAEARVAPNLRVGYVRGFDYSLPNALTALGVESKELTVDEIKTADLANYTSLIVDNRVYESTPGLIETNQKLLDYAQNGGTLIVFYHKSNEWNPDPKRNRPELAPYKLILGDERITDETAPITFLEPGHPLLNSPNKLGQEDFANWIQERGLYYPKEWDPQFRALLQSNDPGETPLKGGLLVADYGRGHYIYSSMVWYRELRAGVPGAYRMLANMISYGAKK